MSKTRKPKVDVAEADMQVEDTVASEPVVAAPSEGLKEIISKLVEEAPTLAEVQRNPWLYTEWLARLNTMLLL
jgi:hypothetical protein